MNQFCVDGYGVPLGHAAMGESEAWCGSTHLKFQLLETLRQEDQKFECCLDNLVRASLRKRERVLVHSESAYCVQGPRFNSYYWKKNTYIYTK